MSGNTNAEKDELNNIRIEIFVITHMYDDFDIVIADDLNCSLSTLIRSQKCNLS